MKRSVHVSLVLVTVAGIGVGAYALTPDNCRRSEPDAVPRDPMSDPPKDCRSAGGHSSGGHSASFFSSNSGSSTDRTSASTSRGGFGSIGRALSGGG